MSAYANDPDLKAVNGMSWLLVLLGIVSLGVGLFFIASPHETLATFTVIAGIVLLFEGAIAVLSSIFGHGEGRGLLATAGVLSIIAGLILVKHPFSSLVVFVLIIGIWLVASGIVRFVTAFGDSEGRGSQILGSLVDLIAGIVILTWPDLSLSTLAVIVGVVLAIRGIAWVYVGFESHRAAKDVNSAMASV